MNDPLNRLMQHVNENGLRNVAARSQDLLLLSSRQLGQVDCDQDNFQGWKSIRRCNIRISDPESFISRQIKQKTTTK
jgi:hypothetical protein